jgi:5-methyltetrahydrofolate--homocysteine methyltransferase
VLGPTNRTASISPDVNDPGYRNIDFDTLVTAYAESTRGLIEGGADILLVETVFDTLNAKAALFAVWQVFDEDGVELPIMISGTITDQSGRTLTGQTTEAFYNSLRHAQPSASASTAPSGRGAAPLCARSWRGSRVHDLRPPQRRPAQRARRLRPGPEEMAEEVVDWARRASEHRRRLLRHHAGPHPAIAEGVAGMRPPGHTGDRARLPPVGPGALQHHRDSFFVNVGERTNVTGSARFKRLIKEGDYDTALSVAVEQVENGAQVIDVNMDEGLLDAVEAMRGS